jgi:hypothetical protein
LLVEGGIRALRRAREVLGLAPAMLPIEAGEVDVPQPATLVRRLAADEEEAASTNGGRAEVVRRGVDRRAKVLGCAEEAVLARSPGDPDIE